MQFRRVAFVLIQSKRLYNAGVIPEMIAVQLIHKYTKTLMTKISANLCARRSAFLYAFLSLIFNFI